MVSKVYSAIVVGMQVIPITVETDIAKRGFPQLKIVGLPGKSVEEAKERVRTALVNSGFSIPARRIIVNLAPADVPKQSSQFDVPIALGILAAQGIFYAGKLQNALFIGEISLNGDIKAVDGVLPMLDAAEQKGFKKMYIPALNSDEAVFVDRNMHIFGVRSLSELVKDLQDVQSISRIVAERESGSMEAGFHSETNDFRYIKGQQHAKRALEIAAAGGHNIILKGPPGTGKTMLAKAFISILPPLTDAERLDIAKVQSIMYGGKGEGLSIARAFRAPHHTISRAGMIGGGAELKPGEVTLAHRGVLFLDEYLEFPRAITEALRQPLEDGIVTITRVHGSVTYPSRFLLIAATNPCPCGFNGSKEKRCTCTGQQVDLYNRRLSGPILDRIDIHITVPHISEKDLLQPDSDEEPSAHIRARIIKARAIQHARGAINVELSSQDIKKIVQLDPPARDLLTRAFQNLHFSPRSYFKILKVAQTVADLEEKTHISQQMIAEAIQYRSFLYR